MKGKDLYSILGVTKNADDKELKRAYRKLAKKYHPDTNQGNASAEQRFKEVTEAYDILSDPEKRKLYDRFGMAAFDGSMGDPNAWQSQDANAHGHFYNHAQGNPFGSGFRWQSSDPDGSYTEYHFTSDGSDDMDDILHDFFGGMFDGRNTKKHSSDGFSYDSPFGSARRTGSSYRDYPGEDLHAGITITFEEAALGCDKLLTIDGSRKEQLQVHIPAGIDEGQSVRLKGKGYSGIKGGREGDLLLKVHILDSPVYERKGKDVYTKAFIPYTTAALGGDARFHTLYGAVQCHVPAGTQAGGKIRLKNKGIVSMKDPSQKGDEYVIIQIEVPKAMSPEERDALEKLRSVQSRKSRANQQDRPNQRAS